MRNKIIVVLTVLLVAASLFVACGNSVNDKAAIEDTIRGYVSTFNNYHFEKTLDYFTGYGNHDDAIAYLAYLRDLSGELILVNFTQDSIAITGNTARVPVEFIIMGEQSSQWLYLQKESDGWRILWNQ